MRARSNHPTPCSKTKTESKNKNNARSVLIRKDQLPLGSAPQNKSRQINRSVLGLKGQQPLNPKL